MNKRKPMPLAYTKKYNHKVNCINETVFITPPNTYDKTSKIDDKYKINGVWDTGASTTAISEELVTKLNLPPISITQVNTANGTTLATRHVVDLYLPNRVVIQNLVVTSAKLAAPIQILIGMDVITKGDFSISNHNNKTTLSFRMPSLGETDYVEMYNSQIPVKNINGKAKRNTPCPCGSGKKYKNCCGKNR